MMYKILNQCTSINNMMASHIKKLPKYSGLRIRLYMPFVLSSLQLVCGCFYQSPFGVYPKVIALISCPKRPIAKHPISKVRE